MFQTDMKVRAIFAAFILIQMPLQGDMGSIPFDPNAEIAEPNQRALIAWNGTEQVLILSTDLRASKDTKVLEVMPCPSEPDIKGVDNIVFERVTAMINTKLQARAYESVAASLDGGPLSAAPPPAGKVTAHEQISAHNLSTIRVESGPGFVEWARAYLKKQGVENPEIPKELAEVIDEYIRESFRWFVFDVVSLTKEPKTKTALQFRFKTPFLFYPMRITRVEKGETKVHLMVFSEHVFRPEMFLGIPNTEMKLDFQSVTFNKVELRALGVFGEVLGSPLSVKVRSWEIKGRIDGFKEDVIVGDPREYIRFLRGR
jgi:hypothetical protein